MSSKTWLITGTSTGLGRPDDGAPAGAGRQRDCYPAQARRAGMTCGHNTAGSFMSCCWTLRRRMRYVERYSRHSTSPGVSMCWSVMRDTGSSARRKRVSDTQIDRQICHQSHRSDSAYFGPPYPLCVGREGDALCRYRQKGGRLPGRISAFITPPNGGG
ncbi:Uncharacterised protein [Raoultella planticola]|uniref:Uncharacterized protein n=1 Tax=Raoultella planticola TaxID=575 RepID=A0A485AVS0_RAOPL|nr:Uncharacterised protein [Raoultella planticola]